jgi:thiamine pyrophosphokinase
MSQTTVILANGELTDPATVRRYLEMATSIICADGGYVHAQRLGVQPQAVVGDLDSFNSAERGAAEEAGVKFIVHPRHKDETDLELALDYAIEQGAEEVIILAALGGRLDQLMANLLLLARPEWRHVPMRVIAGAQEAFIMRGGDAVTLDGAAGDTISLIPLEGDALGVTLEGMEYPLLRGTLRFGATLGISNVLNDPPGHIYLESGTLLCVHIRNT